MDFIIGACIGFIAFVFGCYIGGRNKTEEKSPMLLRVTILKENNNEKK